MISSECPYNEYAMVELMEDAKERKSSVLGKYTVEETVGAIVDFMCDGAYEDVIEALQCHPEILALAVGRKP